MARVVVGMSGGVDSSVAAYLLKKQGHEVIGLFMRNWNDASVTLEDECPWIDDSRDAMLVAEQLGIPFQVLDLSEEYKTRIVDYMFSEYAAGRTPNPDVLCNREIKFDVFLKAAIKLGADFVGTGHYVQKDEIQKDGKKIYRLLSGRDPNKDQSYFLCQLNQEQLSKALFPIGGMLKPEVREIAMREGFVTAEKKDSQGLCFIGKVSLPEFLQQQLKPKSGEIIEVPVDAPKMRARMAILENADAPAETLSALPHLELADGHSTGQHNGAHYFTIGQRKGLHNGGKPLPSFILETDTKNNLVYVGQGADHPGLLNRALKLDKAGLHWVRPDLQMAENERRKYKMRIRYRQQLFDGTLLLQHGKYYALFDELQRSVTPGQFLAVYDGPELVASGVIA